MEWYRLTPEQTLQQIDSDGTQGLDEAEVTRRRNEYGPNELAEQRGRSPLRMLWEQFTETMVVILILAAIVSAMLGKTTETVAILAIVIMFAILGFIQEYRAEKAMAALKRLGAPIVRARRGGALKEIPSSALVPGDIVFLEAGNVVAADVRLLESVNLRVQEAALTGESEPVEKTTRAFDQPDLPLGDRRNMGYLGTVVTYGRGMAIVVETGMRTELGKVATLIQSVASEDTPLQIRLGQVGKTLAGVGLIAAILVAAVGLLRGEPLVDMFVTAVSVAVAVIPEGLPAVVTITLAIGAQRMLKRNALIRRLPAVETLGSVTVICSDKTGTLTQNRMTVTVVDVAGHTLDLVESMRRQAPTITAAECRSDLLVDRPLAFGLALAGGVLCNDATLAPDPKDGCFHAIGDPTEGALLVAGAQANLFKDALQAVLIRVGELPFDSERKRMTTIHRLPDFAASLPDAARLLWRNDGRFVAITKGAVDGLIGLASQVWVDDRPQAIDGPMQERIRAANDRLAENGMRVLGVACRWLEAVPGDCTPDTLERDLVFVGMVGMIDPPRPEVLSAIQTCQMAGMRTVMITGDHPLTASAIARQLGIMADDRNSQVLTGAELSRLSASDLSQKVQEVSVYARVSPEDKLKIVDALQGQGQVVAMTGDGVNDSPALKKADIGVAMGLQGTDVAKEAADMVLLDDNFVTIVAAVEEGRVIYDNILRFVKFSIGGNLAKVLVMLVAPLLGINVALLPLQLLWLNLLTDGLMGLGLGMEPAEQNTMRRPPRSPQASLFAGGSARHMLWVGPTIAAVGLLVGRLYFDPSNPGDKTWQTMLFTTLAFAQIGHALGLRSVAKARLLDMGANPAMFLVLPVTILLQLMAVYVPFLDDFFKVVPLSAGRLAVCAVCGILVWGMVEAEKLLSRQGPPRSGADLHHDRARAVPDSIPLRPTARGKRIGQRS
jgi:Ca2+-transporting ATPase